MSRRLYTSTADGLDVLSFSTGGSKRGGRMVTAGAWYTFGYAVGVVIIFGMLFLMATVLEHTQEMSHHIRNNGDQGTTLSTGKETATAALNEPNTIVKPIVPSEILPPSAPMATTPMIATTITETTEKEEESPMTILNKLFELGRKDPKALIKELDENDPLHVNIVDPHAFICPISTSLQLDYPSIINEQNLQSFRDGSPDSFIFYQHLRKAGGTGFCDLAQRNLPKGSVPAYYCMPDNRGSLALPPWNDPIYLSEYMQKKGYKIAANEWDVFHTNQADIPHVILATTIRHPIDRWYSQYRFEHLEHRDGSDGKAPRQTLRQFYDSMKGWTMGVNYYIKTFIGDFDPKPPRNTGDFYWTYHKYQKRPLTWGQFTMSLHNLRRFHLLLVTEWLDSSPPMLLNKLGWTSPPKQVLPHEVQAVREKKKSVSAREVTPPEDYQFMLQENVLDVLYFHAAKRIYLERLMCGV